MDKFFTRLFKPKNKKSATLEIETKPLSLEQLEEARHRLSFSIKPAQLIHGSAQSVGVQRDHNEDALFALSAVLAEGSNQIPFGIFIIADGMGGHMHGEVASGVAARAMAESIIKKLYSPLLGANPGDQTESLQEIMEQGVFEAQEAVLKKAPGGGTTLTAALILGEQVIIAHVGDSRAYFLYPHQESEILTQDHSLVHKLVQMGQLTDDEAAVHPQKNILYRAIGQHEPFHPDIKNIPFPRSGVLMLCSDGLWGVISEEEMFQALKQSPTLPQACQLMVNAANSAGGPDNISVILVQYLD